MLTFIPLAAELVALSEVPPMTWVEHSFTGQLLHVCTGYDFTLLGNAAHVLQGSQVRILGQCVPPESPAKVMRKFGELKPGDVCSGLGMIVVKTIELSACGIAVNAILVTDYECRRLSDSTEVELLGRMETG